MKHLPEILNVFRIIVSKTDQLEVFRQNVNELLLDELMKDLTLYRFQKEKLEDRFIYQVREDDFDHICEYIALVQNYIEPDIEVMLHNSQEDYKVMFKIRKD